MTEFSPGFKEWMQKLGLPNEPAIIVFRGQVFKVDFSSGKLVTVKFLGYVGTSSTFAVISGEPKGVRVLREPRIYRRKIVREGVFLLR